MESGVTLSSGQAAACVKNGLDVHVMDCRKITPENFGVFDAVTCIGGMEHFCSIEEYKAGKQDEVYHNFFKAKRSVANRREVLYADNGILIKI